MSMRFIGDSLEQDQGVFLMCVRHGKEGVDAFAVPDNGLEPLGALRAWADENASDPAAARLAQALERTGSPDGTRGDLTRYASLGDALASVRASKVHDFSGLRLAECPGMRIDGQTAGASWLLNLAPDGGRAGYAFWEQSGTPAGHHYGEILDIARDFRGSRGSDTPHREMDSLVRQAEVRNQARVRAPQKKPTIGGR